MLHIVALFRLPDGATRGVDAERSGLTPVIPAVTATYCFGYALQLLTIASIDPRITAVNYGFVKSKVRGNTTLETPPTIVLCFVLAIVVGYFAGRVMTIRERMRSDRDF